MRLLPKRVDQEVERAASGTAVPAGTEPAPERSQAGSRERGKARRRLRQLRRMREALLLELGALVFEMERRGRREAGMLQIRVDRLRAIEEEAGALSSMLGQEGRLEELVTAGVAGECASCGTLMSVGDNFCPNCATPFSRRARRAAAPAGDDAGTSGSPAAGSGGGPVEGGSGPATGGSGKAGTDAAAGGIGAAGAEVSGSGSEDPAAAEKASSDGTESPGGATAEPAERPVDAGPSTGREDHAGSADAPSASAADTAVQGPPRGDAPDAPEGDRAEAPGEGSVDGERAGSPGAASKS